MTFSTESVLAGASAVAAADAAASVVVTPDTWASVEDAVASAAAATAAAAASASSVDGVAGTGEEVPGGGAGSLRCMERVGWCGTASGLILVMSTSSEREGVEVSCGDGIVGAPFLEALDVFDR